MDCFESLRVWKKAAALGAEICMEFRGSKDFGFKDQITRSGLSVSSNIAEGFERSSYRHFGYFLKIAKGSAGELRSQIYVGMKTGAINKELGNKWIAQSKEISRMLYSLIEATTKNAKQENSQKTPVHT